MRWARPPGWSVKVEAKLAAEFARRGADNNLEILFVKPVK